MKGRTASVAAGRLATLGLLVALVGACGLDEDITGTAGGDAADRLVPSAIDASTGAHPSPVINASLRNGDYGGGATNIPPVGGLVDTPDGVRFVASAPSTRSWGIVSWNLPSLGVSKLDIRSSGTLSFLVYVDSDNYVPGEMVGENYGFNGFNNGQGTFGLSLLSLGAGGKVGIHTAAWLSGFFDVHNTLDAFAPDEWHSIGFTWGDSDFDYKVCVDGVVINSYDTPANRSLPWGLPFSAEQLGLGTHHERLLRPGPAAPSGVTVADFRLSTDPVPACGTEAPAPANSPPVAVDDLAATTPHTPVDIDVLANDSDPDGDAIAVVAVTQSATTGATVSINPDGTVRYAPVDVDRIADAVQGLPGLNKGQIRSLMAKLEAAARSLERGNGNAAAGQLGAFVNQIEAFERTGKIDAATAAALLALVDEVLDPPTADSFTYTISDGELTDDATVTVDIQP